MFSVCFLSVRWQLCSLLAFVVRGELVIAVEFLLLRKRLGGREGANEGTWGGVEKRSYSLDCCALGSRSMCLAWCTCQALVFVCFTMR